MKQKIVIAGGSGFLGRALENFLTHRGVNVIILTRHPHKQNDIYWDGKTKGEWVNHIEGAWAVINLAGKSVNCRYNTENKSEILLSRIYSTKVLGNVIAHASNPPEFWFNASTATIYDDTRGDHPANTEEAISTGSNFSVSIAKAWENEFNKHKTPDTKKITLRTSIVWGTSGGAFRTLADLAKQGVCSPQGTGDQWISWIHIRDFCHGLFFLLHNEQEGIFNMAAPNPIQNAQFYKIMNFYFKPKCVIPQPLWILELGAMFLRTETELVLKSRKVISNRLEQLGFAFKYKQAKDAIQHLVK